MASVGEATDGHGTNEQLREEVTELSDLLRTDDAFGDLRDLLAAHGLLVSETLLAGLIEGEDERRYGVFVTAHLDFVRFEILKNGRLTLWEIVDDPDTLAEDFGAAAVGITMKRAGQIC